MNNSSVGPRPERLVVYAYKLLFRFTSLGENCEFGLVQRRAGVEPLGLLRFAFCRIQPLIEAIQDGFADLDPLQALTIDQPWTDEYITTFGTRGFQQHTFRRSGDVDPDRLRRQEAIRIPFLRRRLMEDLVTSETLFVRTSRDHAPAEMLALHRAMRVYGPNTLLWVELADAENPAGKVELIEAGLIRGYVDRFAPYGEATAVSFDCWLTLCVRSFELVYGSLPHSDDPPAALQIGRQASLLGSNAIAFTVLDDVSGVIGGDQVFRHGTDKMCNNVAAVLEPISVIPSGEVCTASCWTRIPSKFRGRFVGILPIREATITIQPAILLDRPFWQRIWVSVVNRSMQPLQFGLWLQAEADDYIETTHWAFEQSDHPGSYLLDTTRFFMNSDVLG